MGRKVDGGMKNALTSAVRRRYPVGSTVLLGILDVPITFEL